MHKTTLEQWQVLQTVIEAGGFTRAAAQLHRSQSAVSYAIAQLQERLGATLIEVEGRKVRLTETGAALLRDARPLITQLDGLEARAKALTQGTQACVRFAVDSAYPKRSLFAVLKRFAADFPHTQIELSEVMRLNAEQARARSDLAIVFQTTTVLAEHRLADVELLAVAAHDHPLLQAGQTTLSTADLAPHLQVRLEDSQQPAHTGDEGKRRQWSVNTVESAREAVLSGLCFGWLPRHVIADDLTGGTLCPLPLRTGAKRSIPLSLVFADVEQAGPATRALADLLLRMDAHQNIG
ncbi:MAG: LysR family transcriptional regulator [Paludibacterium sp.]|uniref:LysR family transcriptional regulator n=1 Tax=Paludibacterium sp. TaxID=1917523 RepID=UPI0025DC758F|nr:LysR family transcriptional regulator [Paludibacterium sp.]MBV8048951.1 LysR family transcriptional regulator [Paludibacterium sp.]MBV8647311.1 LysR family transcriptional regulator [Paludibacterium sp.]